MRAWLHLCCVIIVGAVMCPALAQRISPDEALDLLIAHLDNNMDRIRSGRVQFTHTRQPTDEGKRVLPKLARQVPEAASFVLGDLTAETISGELIFRGYHWCIHGRRWRDTSLVEKAGVRLAQGQSTIQEGRFEVGYDGQRSTVYDVVTSDRNHAHIYREIGTDFGDVRSPALYDEGGSPPQWSEKLRRARQSGRLKLVRVDGEPGKRVFVARFVPHSPEKPKSSETGLYWILHFAEEWGYMLRLQEVYTTGMYAGKTATWKTIEFRVVSAQELLPGVWFPTETVEVFWSGELGAPFTSPLVPAAERRTTITVKEWNRPISDSALRPRLPAGLIVYDHTTGRYHRVTHPLFGLPHPIGAGIILVLLGAFLWWRFRKAGSMAK